MSAASSLSVTSVSKQTEDLPSELCSICYTSPPKYRCPRCTARTCSLPCSQKHKQRASCSGQRDPAAYLKKSALATPAGIDQDYNFLKGVERSLESAGRRTAELDDEGHGSARDSNVQRYLAANRVRVLRAPRGMARGRGNWTRWTKNKRIMWTVEWIDQNDEKITQNNCLEFQTLTELYDFLLLEKSNAAKRKLAKEDRTEVKRRRVDALAKSQDEGRQSEDSPKSVTEPVDGDEAAAGNDSIQKASEHDLHEFNTAETPPSHLEAKISTPKHKAPDSSVEETANTVLDPQALERLPEASGKRASRSSTTFYLLKPRTAFGKKSLDPTFRDFNTHRSTTRPDGARISDYLRTAGAFSGEVCAGGGVSSAAEGGGRGARGGAEGY